jgi:hypothetical protein
VTAAGLQHAGLLAGAVVVLLSFGFVAGCLYEHLRANGSRDLAQRVDAARGQLNDYWHAADDAVATAAQCREDARAEHERADRERSLRLLAEDELGARRAGAAVTHQVLARTAEVVDLALWTAEHARPEPAVWMPP